MEGFVTAMDATCRVRGENGAWNEKTSPLLTLYEKTVRDLTDASLDRMFAEVVQRGGCDLDLLLMCFHVRATRNVGKGEKRLGRRMFTNLVRHYGDAVLPLLRLLPEYGSWADLVAMHGDASASRALRNMCVSLMAEALSNKNDHSLAAKWAPTNERNRGTKPLLKELVRSLFEDAVDGRQKYRQLVVAKRRRIDSPETKMASGHWSEIKASSIPAVCLRKQRKAFLNEKLKEAPLSHEEDSGNRHPYSEDRIACRRNVRRAMSSSKGVRGAQSDPHEIVSPFCAPGSVTLSTTESQLLEAQWSAMRAKVASNVHASDGASIDIGECVVMCDVSPSMTGTYGASKIEPYKVSVALAILCSELARPPFANRVLTFASDPTWVGLTEGAPLRDKVKALMHASWGSSTNIIAALRKILNAATTAQAPRLPTLLVLSDMQFDQADSGYHTTHELFAKQCAQAGYEPPRVVFWNLRGETVGSPVGDHTRNVQMLSGFSPSVLRAMLESGNLPTPWKTMRASLDDQRLDLVRNTIRTLGIHPFCTELPAVGGVTSDCVACL